MKKVCIITHSLRYNYGGILQNYALQQVLKKNGYEPITLWLRRASQPMQTLYIYVRRFIDNLRGTKNGLLTSKEIDFLCQKTDLFTEKNITLSPKMNNINKRWVKKQHFDCFVVGSDQVLNPYSYPHIEDIWLGFVKSNFKVMYAGSFGTSKWLYTKKQTRHCRNLAKEFNLLSVRENSGVANFKEYLGVDVPLVCDPTLLLQAEDYNEKISEKVGEGKLVTYILDPNKNKKEIVNHLSQTYELEVYSSNNENFDNVGADLKSRVTDSVERWLSAIAYSGFVVTDSYHGMLFSIIFKRQFICIGNKKRGIDRFHTVLKKLGLEDRLVYVASDLSTEMIVKKIDYSIVDSKLDEFRGQSFNLLMEGLK